VKRGLAALAVVLGGAACLWDDLVRLGAFTGAVVAVNQAGIHYPHPIQYWATLHPANLLHWRGERARRGHDMAFEAWTDRVGGWDTGSSGLHAAGCALRAGYGPVVLCGVPMDASEHFHGVDPWPHADVHWPAWLAKADEMRGRVFSMSGRTRDLLGAPPWLQGST